MVILLINSTGMRAHVILARDATIIAQQDCRIGRTFGTALLSAITDVLAQAELPLSAVDRVAVHTGPAQSFMALRTAVITAAMLAYATGAEVVEANEGALKTIFKQASQGSGLDVITAHYEAKKAT